MILVTDTVNLGKMCHKPYNARGSNKFGKHCINVLRMKM